MKKTYFKHLIQFAAAMSLCAAILPGTPASGIPKPGIGDDITKINMEEPGTGKSSETEPEITPQNDLDPELTNTQ